MASWDKPSSGNQEGPRPSAFRYIPRASPSDSPDTPEVGKTERTDTKADSQADREPVAKDKIRDSEKVTHLESAVKRFEGLVQRQSDLIDSQQKQIDRLSSDLDRQDKTIEKLEEKNERQAKELDSKDAEIQRLEGELVKQSDKPSGVDRSPVDQAPDVLTDEKMGNRAEAADRSWRTYIPSEKLVGIGTTVAGLGQAIAAGTHHMSSAESGIITASIGVGVSVLGYAREKYVEKRNNADRP